MKQLIGKTITGVRWMTETELNAHGWDDWPRCVVIELDDGTILYPSKDDEGNGSGVIFGDGQDDEFYVYPEEDDDGRKAS